MLNAPAVGKLLGLSARTVYDLHARGLLPGYRFGRALRFDPVDVEAYRASCRTVVAPAPSVVSRRPTVALRAAAPDLAAVFRAYGVKPRLKPPGGRA